MELLSYDANMKVLQPESLTETIMKAHFMTAGPPGHDDQNLYELSMDLGFHLVYPARQYRITPTERVEIADFYESALRQIPTAVLIALLDACLLQHQGAKGQSTSNQVCDRLLMRPNYDGEMLSLK